MHPLQFPVLLAFLVAACGSRIAAAAPPPRPNILVILSDDQGWGDLSLHGNSNLNTPHLDSLANDGARFEKFFVQPVCSPTRAEFLTGRYHPRGRVRNVSLGGERLNLDESTIADAFTAAGYATGCFGKWHNGSQYPYHPNGRGFREFYGFTSGHWGDYFEPPLEHNGQPLRGEGYLPDDLTDHALKFLRDHRQEPFFCYVAYNIPHSPMQVPEKYWERFRDKELSFRGSSQNAENEAHTRAALAMCECLDDNVGRLLDGLKAQQLDNNTIVVFFCDNGPNGARWNGGLKGIKGTTDEGGVRSPLFVRWPERIAAGTTVRTLAGAIDLLPTLTELAGVPRAGSLPLDGVSFAPELQGKTASAPERVLFQQWGGKISARTPTHRLDANGRLFDLESDPQQKRDVTAEQPERAARLRQAVADWRANVLAPSDGRDDRYFPVGYREHPRTTLPARDGTPHGGIRRSAAAPNCSYFTHWKSLDDQITWPVEVATAGRYRVEINYTCAPADVGVQIELRVGERTLQGTVTEAHNPPAYGAEHDRVPRQGESLTKDFRPWNFGELALPRGPATLSLAALKMPGSQAIEVRSIVLTLVAADAESPSARPASARPNLLFVLCDDLRPDALGCYGSKHVRTPHIDRVAREGVRFSQAFCTTSLCSPSRASILSGLYAHTHGVTNNFTEYPADLPSFPRALQDQSYATAYFGKYHMGEENDAPRRGFDRFVTHKGQGKYYDTEWSFHGEKREVVPGYYTTVVTDLALDWLRQQAPDKPWCLCLGHKAPHSFYTPEPKYAHSFDAVRVPYPATAFQLADKPDWIKQRLYTWHGIYGPLFDWRKKFPDDRPEAVTDFENMVHGYWGTVLSVDDSVGRLLAWLDESHQLDNTILVFMGDNGLLEGEHGMVDKRTAHDPSLRIPIIVRYPKALPRGKVIPQQVLTVDMAPSLLELCQAPPLPKTHGRSWVRLLREGDPDWRTSWFYHYNYEKQFPYTPNVRAVRTERWKYIRYPHGDGGPDRHLAELYDLQNDPGETKNLIRQPERAETVRELRDELSRRMAETGLTEASDRMPLDEGVKAALPDAKIR